MQYPEPFPPYRLVNRRTHSERTTWGRKVMAFTVLHGLTQAKLAKMVGIPVSTLQAVIYGDIAGKKKDVIGRIDAFMSGYTAANTIQE